MLLSKATYSNLCIHTVMAVTAMQGANQQIMISLGFSISRTLQHAYQGNQTNDLPINKTLAYSILFTIKSLYGHCFLGGISGHNAVNTIKWKKTNRLGWVKNKRGQDKSVLMTMKNMYELTSIYKIEEMLKIRCCHTAEQQETIFRGGIQPHE